jgi:hypothetical protein
MFVHQVYFWLKEASSTEENKNFERGIRSLLPIKHISTAYIGKPAGTSREVIDSSYSYSLLLIFENKAAHDAYQVDPVHEQFVSNCSSLWQKVLVYDSESF